VDIEFSQHVTTKGSAPVVAQRRIQNTKILPPQSSTFENDASTSTENTDPQKRVVENTSHFHNTKLHNREMKANLVHKRMMQSQAPEVNRKLDRKPLSLHDKETNTNILHTIFVNLGLFQHFETVTNIRTWIKSHRY
jgi:hypothetical protein